MQTSSQDSEAQRRRLVAAAQTIDQLTDRLRRLQNRTAEPIAVVGMALRMPGGADTPEHFWHLLRDGVDTTGEFPADRGDAKSLYDPDPERPGTAHVIRGAFLDQVDGFDPAVFGISPREAVGMDPQQRLALELSWEALERAGHAPDGLAGSSTGVWLGVSTTDYVRLRQHVGDIRDVDHYQLLGEPSFIAGRISYTLGLRGPSSVLDSACSSSLVAVHQACQSLRQGETDMALAGGVNMLLAPYGFVLMSKFRALAADGRCKTFDEAADGYARGEGGVVFVLKRLSDAVADGNTVLAVVRGSAVNHDGRSSGLTVPSPEAQQAVIRSALGAGGVAPSDVDYVEAHGTGTSLGDPIELRALDAVLGPGRPADRPLLVGSVKTNIGHLEPAAGAAGLAKVILSLQHDELPPHLHLRNPNPLVRWDRLRVRVPTAREPWPAEGSRIAAVSSFGASGTNAHVVVGRPEPEEQPAPAGTGPRPEALVLSARTPQALKALAAQWADLLTSAHRSALADLCHTSQVGRARLEHGCAVVGADPDELGARLAAWARGTGEGVISGAQAPRRARTTAWLLTGQGSQYAGMARGLAEHPVSAAALRECAAHLDPLLPVPLERVLAGDGADINDTRYTQPALFALEYALGRYLLNCLPAPVALLGHSVGEIAAACLAGAIELGDAARLVAERGRLMSALPAGGTMVAVVCDEATALSAIREAGGTVALAAVNGPTDVVLSGAAEDVQRAVRILRDGGRRASALTVSHAFHSPLMEPMLEEFRRVLAGITVRKPKIPIVSDVTGQLWTDEQLTPEYWVRHALGTVRFADGLATLVERGARTFVEVGPHPVLTGLGRGQFGDDEHAWVPMLRRGREPRAELLAGLATMHVRGCPVDWAVVGQDRPARRVPAPTYPWERQRFWFRPLDDPAAAAGGPEIPGLGRRVRAADPTFEQTAGDEPVAPVDLAAVVERAVRAAAAGYGGYWHAVDAARLEPAPDATLVRCTAVPASVAGDEGVRVDIRAALPELDRAGLPWPRTAEVLVRRGTPGTGTPRTTRDEHAAAWGRIVHLAVGAAVRASGDSGALEAVALADATCRHPEAVASADAVRRQNPDDEAAFDITLTGADGEVLGAVRDLRLRPPRPPAPGWRAEADLLMALAWERLPEEAAPPVAAAAERVAIVADDHGTGLRLAAELTARGARCTVLSVPDARHEDRTGLDLPDAGPAGGDGLDAARELVRQLAIGPAITRVVVAASLDAPDPAADGTAALPERLLPVELLTVGLARRLGELPSAPRLVLLTRGAVAAVDQQKTHRPAGHTLWGLGRVVALEHPEAWGGVVDLDPDGEDDLAVVADALLSTAEEDQQAVRGRERYVARLRRLPATAVPRTAPARPVRSGTVLITGGFGGIGVVLARWLAAAGAERLVLAGRTALPPEDQWDAPDLPEGVRQRVAALRGLRALGAEARAEALDVTDPGAVHALVRRLADEGEADGVPLRGVVHAAGVSGPQFLRDVDAGSYAKVWLPKTVGTWALHEATRDLDLDLFLCFSSIASVWGSQHLGSYAAGNAFLDSLAYARRAQGLPALTVNWGPWELASDLFDADVMAFLESVGLRQLHAPQCVALLPRLLAGAGAQYVVCAADWATYKQVMEARAERPVLRDLDVGAAEEEQHDDALLSELTEAGPAGRTEVLAGFLRGAVADVLHLDRTGLTSDSDVFALGLDSLMVMELVTKARRALGVALRPADFFERSTISEWATHLDGMTAGPESTPEAAEKADLSRPAGLRERAVLPADVPAPGALDGSWRSPRSVLLTGATGFVGAHLLDELLRRTDTEVVCLVRCTDEAAGLRRLRENAVRYLSWPDDADRRIRVLPGDLARPGLGIEAGERDALAHTVDAIYHNGARVNFAYPYDQVAAANVDSFTEIVRLAAERRQVPVHHVSTYGIWGLPDSHRRIREQDDIDGAGKLITGYVQSKWAAEHLARQAVGRGLPVDVYRLGRVLGHSSTGAALTTHFTCRVIKGCVQLGLAPELDIDIEMTPVDYVARALIEISLSKESFGDVYHLVNPAKMPFATMLDHLRARGWRVETVERHRWWDALRESLERDPGGNELHTVMDTVEELVVGGEEAIDYDTSGAEKALAGSGISCPPLDGTLLGTYLDYFVRTGYLAPPERRNRQ